MGDPYEDFQAATRGLLFTKDFNPSLEAKIRDPLATATERVTAWLKRSAWGNYRLYAIVGDRPACQADCVAATGLSKSRISHTIAYLEKRGEVRCDGKLLYPVIAPEPGPHPDEVANPRAFAAFFEDWKVAHSSHFAELEVARSTLKRLRKVVLSDYKQWRASRTNGALPYKTGRLEDSSPTAAAISHQEDNPPPPPPAECSEVAEVAKRLEVDEAAAARMLAGARKRNPDLEWRVVVELALAKLHQIRDAKSIENRVGLLIRAMPDLATGGALAAAKKKARSRVREERSDATYRAQQAEGILQEPDLPLDVRKEYERERIQAQREIQSLAQEELA